MRQFVVTLLVVLACIGCTSSTAGTSAAPPCASTFAGTWTLYDARAETPTTPVAPCSALKKEYASTLTIGDRLDTWTEVDADGSEVSYAVTSIDCTSNRIVATKHETRDGVTVDATRSITLGGSSAPELRGETTITVSPGDCSVSYVTTAGRP